MAQYLEFVNTPSYGAPNGSGTEPSSISIGGITYYYGSGYTITYEDDSGQPASASTLADAGLSTSIGPTSFPAMSIISTDASDISSGFSPWFAYSYPDGPPTADPLSNQLYLYITTTLSGVVNALPAVDPIESIEFQPYGNTYPVILYWQGEVFYQLPSLVLFTPTADTVDFNNLTADQQSAVASGADLYHGLGGSDTVTLPNVANYNESVGNGQTLNWDPSQTFTTGSLAGDTYQVTGGDGNYNIAEGAGTESITISGNGNSAITAGTGSDTISLTGTGNNTVNGGGGNYNITLGSGTDIVSITGTGTSKITAGPTTGSNFDTIELTGPYYDSNSGPVFVNGGSPRLTLANLVVGDQIDLPGFVANYATILPEDTTDATLAVSDSNGDILSYSLTNTQLYTSFSIASDGSGGSILTLTEKPSLLDLAALATDVYNTSPQGVSGWNPIFHVTDGEFSAEAYVDPDDSQIVIAFRGTNFNDPMQGIKQTLTDIATVAAGGQPTPGFAQTLKDATTFLAQIETSHPGAQITLTGHSLGGAVAELEGEASGLSTMVFDAPGVQNLYQYVSNAGYLPTQDVAVGNKIVNFRTTGDLVSLVGQQSGTTETIEPQTPGPSSPLAAHSIALIATDELTATGTTLKDGTAAGFGLNTVSSIVTPFLTTPGVGRFISQFAFQVNAGINYIDPSSGTEFIYNQTSTSPLITAVSFEADPSASSFEVWAEGSDSPPETVSAGTTVSFGAGVEGFRYEALSSTGQVVSLPDGYIFDATYASSGSVSAILQEWNSTPSVANDFTGFATSSILLQNSAGTMVDWIVNNGAITAGNNLGTNPGWNPVGTGDFTGNGVSDILMQNASGTIVDWTMQNGTVSNAPVLGNSVGFNVVGTGDFTGNGTDDILLQNSAGDVVDWIVSNGAITAGNNLGINPGWNVVGTGDFNGDGTTDVLLESSTGTVVDWTMGGGTVASAAVIGNASGYNIVGTGDFTGNGTADILLQNAAGDLVDWIMSNGAITGGHDLGVNPGWTVAATGDYTGNGISDILLSNAAGNVVDWTMGNGVVTNGVLVGNSAGFTVKH